MCVCVLGEIPIKPCSTTMEKSNFSNCQNRSLPHGRSMSGKTLYRAYWTARLKNPHITIIVISKAVVRSASDYDFEMFYSLHAAPRLHHPIRPYMGLSLDSLGFPTHLIVIMLLWLHPAHSKTLAGVIFYAIIIAIQAYTQFQIPCI